MPTRLQLEASIHRIASRSSSVELIHTPHDRWPWPYSVHPHTLPRDASMPAATHASRLKVSILDSSFNPPTLAHLALASLLPPATNGEQTTCDFDARLLLLSVRNADKSLSSSDATYTERLEMMIRLSQDISLVKQSGRSNTSTPHPLKMSDDPLQSNVAVAIIDEPTFVGKARTLNEFLREKIASLATLSVTSGSQASFAVPSEDPVPIDPELTFIVGIDTLERILATRYYPSPSEMRRYLKQFMSSARLICSRRIIPGQLGDLQAEREKAVLALAREYLDVAKLSVVDLSKDIESFSSSEVRQRIAEGNTEVWTKMVTPSIAEYIHVQGLYAVQAKSQQKTSIPRS